MSLIKARWEIVERVAKTYSGDTAVEKSSRDQRRDDMALRALYAVHSKRLIQENHAPLGEICSQCGEITFSWCESCARRGMHYRHAVCSYCDRRRLTCRSCELEGHVHPDDAGSQASSGIECFQGEIGQDE